MASVVKASLSRTTRLAAPARPVFAFQPCTTARSRVAPRVFARSGGNVLDKSSSVAPTHEKGTEGSFKRPPIYKLMLHNDNYNRREYVVKVLIKTVASVTMDDAVTIMQEAHETGVALVVSCPQEEAEKYCEGLRINGLTSSIEPSS